METIDWLKSKKDEIKSITKVDGGLTQLFEIKFKNGDSIKIDMRITEIEIESLGLLDAERRKCQ